MPTQSPLMIRPTINMPIFTEAQTNIEPTHLKQNPQQLQSRMIRNSIALTR